MMPETLRQYRERTAFMADSLAPCGGLRTSDSLTRKVGPDGSFRPFYGDTVIFSLEEDVIRWLEGVQGHGQPGDVAGANAPGGYLFPPSGGGDAVLQRQEAGFPRAAQPKAAFAGGKAHIRITVHHAHGPFLLHPGRLGCQPTSIRHFTGRTASPCHSRENATSKTRSS